MINTYKKEFTVANWSEIKLILRAYELKTLPNWEGLKYITDFALFTFYPVLIELRETKGLDFIDCDK